MSGSLDHALRPRRLLAKVTDLDPLEHQRRRVVRLPVHRRPGAVRADPYRSSDHDPLILGIDLERAVRRTAGRRSSGTPGRMCCAGPTGQDVIMGLGGADVISGGNGDDIICGGAGADNLSAAATVTTCSSADRC